MEDYFSSSENGEEKGNWEELLFRFRYPLLFLLLGLIMVGFGALYLKKESSSNLRNTEMLESATESQNRIIIEVSGAVENPGVYSFLENERVEDALVKAGGITADADRNWIEKYLNRAAKLSDGQKLYIPFIGKQSDVLSAKENGGNQSVSTNISLPGEGLININTASLKELDTLPGIGPVYGQNIIEQRPYSNVDELLSRGVLKPSTFEKIKNLISVY